MAVEFVTLSAIGSALGAYTLFGIYLLSSGRATRHPKKHR